jgi:predicted TIM-barrel fold metal-dependent hydrolase
MSPAFARPDAVERIRRRLDHPVIDSDGHQVEFMPLVREYAVELGGETAGRALDRMVESGRAVLEVPPGDERRRRGLYRTGWWSLPTRNALDRGTAMLPRLLHARLDEIGIDYAVLYPTYGFFAGLPAEAELRSVFTRAFNRYSASAFAEVRDRLEPVAVIPTAHPDEALEEIRFAVGELGLKTLMFSAAVARPYPGQPDDSPARWIDTLAHDSPYDFAPVWALCDELGLSATFHSGGQGWGSRASTRNYLYNHIGSFAAGAEAAARSLFFGGVPMRHPSLRFSFLEGGVAWGASLFADILGHWDKRNRDAVLHYDPDALDRAELAKLFFEYGGADARRLASRLDYGLHMLSEPIADRALLDEFACTGISGPADVISIFRERYFFGCEADDPLTRIAFDAGLHAGGIRLGAVFASDLGHWDVPDLREVLPEAWEQVEHGALSEADFRDFTFGNAVRLWAGSNPDFFAGTAVADAVSRELQRSPGRRAPASG